MLTFALRSTPSLRAAATPLVASHRAAMAVPSRRMVTQSKAETPQQASEGGKQEKAMTAPQQEQQSQRSVAPRSSTLDMVPSLGRINQMFQQMEQEMNAFSRAFGLPSAMPSFSASLFDLPAAASDLHAMPFAAKSLAVDIKDSGHRLEITADVPGLSKEDIRVQVSPDRVLTISGERKTEHKEEEGGTLRIERSYGNFMRRFRLPEAVDVEGIKANVKDGVLHLSVPKSEAAKPKEIDIMVSE